MKVLCHSVNIFISQCKYFAILNINLDSHHVGKRVDLLPILVHRLAQLLVVPPRGGELAREVDGGDGFGGVAREDVTDGAARRREGGEGIDAG